VRERRKHGNLRHISEPDDCIPYFSLGLFQTFLQFHGQRTWEAGGKLKEAPAAPDRIL
jgi:hypothetical protein